MSKTITLVPTGLCKMLEHQGAGKPIAGPTASPPQHSHVHDKDVAKGPQTHEMLDTAHRTPQGQSRIETAPALSRKLEHT